METVEVRMKSILVLIVLLSSPKCFDFSKTVGIAIRNVIENYYVHQHLDFDIIINANSYEVNDLLGAILRTDEIVTAPKVIKMNN